MTGDSRVGVVIATRNRAAGLEETLRRLAGMPERPTVVVVDNASSDRSADRVAESFPGVMLVRLSENRGAAARNVGVERAGTPFVAFCDDDSWWAPGSLTAAAGMFERHPNLGLVAARVLVGPQEHLDPTCIAMQNSPLGNPEGLPGPRVLGFIACGAVVRSEAFRQAGGFHAHFGIGGEEDLLALSMAAKGWDLAYADDLVAYHHPSPIRDRDGRLAVLTRNSLWTAWLLRSPAEVARRTARAVAAGAANSRARQGLLEAFRGLPWVMRERRRLPASVEAMARALEPGS